MTKSIAFITYENSFAPCGGISTVMSRLPLYVKQASGFNMIAITPFHYRITKTFSIKKYMEPVGMFFLDSREMRILRYDDWGQIKDGIIRIQNSFSWEKAAQEYLRCVIN
ncbi:MAG: hypothetical protein JXR70_02045 [Spirochaetales bacterium]|nr:hypothetical protein [Spirochaetales bacterium]